jgi:hypothetical protein
MCNYFVGHKDTAVLLNILDAVAKIQTYIASFTSADEWYRDS